MRAMRTDAVYRAEAEELTAAIEWLVRTHAQVGAIPARAAARENLTMTIAEQMRRADEREEG